MINQSRYHTVKNNHGFGLIQAMVIAAILAVMLTSFASYVYQKNMALKAKANRSDFSQLGNDMKTSINQSGALTKSEDLQVQLLSNPTNVIGGATLEELEPSPTPSPCPSGCSLIEVASGTAYYCQVDDLNCATTGTCPIGCTVPNSP